MSAESKGPGVVFWLAAHGARVAHAFIGAEMTPSERRHLFAAYSERHAPNHRVSICGRHVHNCMGERAGERILAPRSRLRRCKNCERRIAEGRFGLSEKEYIDRSERIAAQALERMRARPAGGAA